MLKEGSAGSDLSHKPPPPDALDEVHLTSMEGRHHYSPLRAPVRPLQPFLFNPFEWHWMRTTKKCSIHQPLSGLLLPLTGQSLAYMSHRPPHSTASAKHWSFSDRFPLFPLLHHLWPSTLPITGF